MPMELAIWLKAFAQLESKQSCTEDNRSVSHLTPAVVEDGRVYERWTSLQEEEEGNTRALQSRLQCRCRYLGCGGEVDNEAKRPRSTSMTPKSGRGMGPNERDRLMGINSVDFSPDEEEGFGDGELTDTENPIGRVADDSETSHSGVGSGLGGC